ncbi:unnamed protein product [Notodromas monacha]|uniref:F-box domain-containing protein n=1 Tax=Notodromas monacha TaxID=399045 RepID=A0A7R9BTK6_9CRUS|nr:unnamed protein product [Notodromas monacha]CAG0919889.1 unnamed protein product [Notodromas monacha]
MDELTSEEMAALDAGDSYTFSSLTSSHVHQVRDQKKLGKKCRDESSLTSIFSVRPIKPGDFRLVMHGKKLRSFDMSLRVNNELKSLEGGINLALGHGDIIECFHRQIREFDNHLIPMIDSASKSDQHHNMPVARLNFQVSSLDFEAAYNLGKRINMYSIYRDNGEVQMLPVNLKINFHEMVMFLQPNGRCVQEDKTPSLLSLPRLMKTMILKCLNPVEAIRNLAPVCRSFFELVRKEDIWTDLELPRHVFSSAPLERLDDFFNFFAGLKRLHLSYIFDWNKPRDRALALPGVDSNAPTEFIHFLGSGVLRSFHAQQFPVEIDEEAWILANKLGTFSSLESLSLCEEMFEEMPVSYEPVPVVLFPELKSIWLQKTVPGRTVRRLMKMPLLERFCVMSSVPRNGYPERKVRRAPFEDYPTGWLENLKFVSDYDLLEAVIPYSKMINLECVALISLSCNEGITACDAHDGSSATCVLEELRWCSKLKGLVLRVPDHGIPNDAFKRMPQEWEFAAFSGLARGVVSTLKSFARNQNSLDDLWIHVSSSKDLKEILRALASFKLLKNVVLVLKQRDRVSCKQSMSACMRAMKMCWGMPSDDIDGSSSSRKTVSDAGGDFFVKQVTLLIVRSYDVAAVLRKESIFPGFYAKQQSDIYVHKLVNGAKMGEPCPAQEHLQKCFSIQENPSGDFLLRKHRAWVSSFRLKALINGKNVLYCSGSIVKLFHGDMIEFFDRQIPCFRVMFLLAVGCPVREPQVSPLLAFPWIIIRNILKFLKPFEMMKHVVLVCQQFFDLFRAGGIWTHLNLNAVVGITEVPFGHLDDFSRLFSVESWVHLETLVIGSSYFGHMFALAAQDGAIVIPNCQELTMLCSLNHACLVAMKQVFPRKQTFQNLESLALLENIFEDMPAFEETSYVLFPKLKTLYLQDVSPLTVLGQLLKMPCLEMLWIKHDHLQSFLQPPPLHVFEECPKEWLANLKSVAADLWETCIPYSKMINLEIVAFFFLHHVLATRPLEILMEELSYCSKLKGLILHVPKYIPCEAFSQLAQKLEFAAFSGEPCKMIPVLKMFAESQSFIEELWIQVLDKNSVEEIICVVKTFKRLRNVAFVFKEEFFFGSRIESCWAWLEALLKRCVCPASGESSLKQVTGICLKLRRYQSFTFNIELQKETDFSSSAIKKFFANGLKYMPNTEERDTISDEVHLVDAIFPDPVLYF